MGAKGHAEILKRMVDLGLDAKDLVRRSGINGSKLSRIVYLKQEPKLTDIISISRALQCDAADLWPQLRNHQIPQEV